MATAQNETGTSARPDLSVALIVGVGGMGMAAARRLGQHHRLLVTDVDIARLEERRATLRDEGYDCSAVACDIGDASSVAALARSLEALGPLGAIAHVAGLSPSMGNWREILTVNLIGARRVETAMRPLAGQGVAAVFISSLAGHMAPPAAEIVDLLDEPLEPGFFDAITSALGEVTPQQAYSMSKFALMRMCRRFASAWGARGARIVSLSPGLIATPMGALEFRNQPAKYDLLAKTPAGREGTMIEIADAIEFLASPRASFVSGTDLLVDGGLAAALAFQNGG
jgi:NAD(P)-dependent dehydrogenase (short-subunit alcohol dehydrogenase family)